MSREVDDTRSGAGGADKVERPGMLREIHERCKLALFAAELRDHSALFCRRREEPSRRLAKSTASDARELEKYSESLRLQMSDSRRETNDDRFFGGASRFLLCFPAGIIVRRTVQGARVYEWVFETRRWEPAREFHCVIPRETILEVDVVPELQGEVRSTLW